MSDATLPRGRAALAGTLAVVCVLVFAAAVGPAGADGTTDVRLVPADGSIVVSETTTVDVVVENSQGGVGAFVARVGLADPANVSVVDVTFHGDPVLSDVETGDGSEIAMGAVLMDTPDSGSVTVATLTVAAVEPGPTELTLTVEPLADEAGNVYTLGTVSGTSMTMQEGDGSGDGGGVPSGVIDDDDDDVLDIDIGQFIEDADTTTTSTTETPGTTTAATTDRTTDTTETAETTTEPDGTTTRSTADGTTTAGDGATSTTGDDDTGFSGLLVALAIVAAVLAVVAAAFLALRRRS